MDIFLDDRTSLTVLRLKARNRGLALAPADRDTPARPTTATTKFHRLQIPGLLAALKVPEKQPLGILVPKAKDRIRAQGVQCKVLAHPRGETPFFQLTSSDSDKPCPIVPESTQAFVLSPPNIVLLMAQRIRRREINKEIDHEQAVLWLIKLCLELCGTYSHDPFDPHMGTIQYKVKPFMQINELRSILYKPGTEQGLSLAREAAALAYDLSGSPQESFIGPALFYKGTYGGLGLCDFKANEPLDLTPQERSSINYRIITPDFTLVNCRSVVEYLGKDHEQGNNPEIDHVRSLDYQTLGIREFGFDYEDVKSRSDFMQSAARVVAAVEQHVGPKVRQQFLKLASDKGFIERQQKLFEIFRPWLRNLSARPNEGPATQAQVGSGKEHKPTDRTQVDGKERPKLTD